MTELLLDTSAWVDLLLDRRPIPGRFRGHEVAACTLSAAELASLGERGRLPRDLLGRLLAEARLEECALSDLVEGGLLHGKLRREGTSKVSLVDCITYSVARRLGISLLTSDRDLEGQPGVFLL